MIVELDNDFYFPIPFKSISSAERQIIIKMHQCRSPPDPHSQSQSKRKQLFGELKLSDRQTIIIICYILTTMAAAQSKTDEVPKTVIYLCKSEQRADWVLRAVEKLLLFLERGLKRILGEENQIKDVRAYGFSRTTQNKLIQDRTPRSKRFFVMPFSQYMRLKLEIKQFIFWESHPDHSIQQIQSQYAFLYKFCMNVDYMFAQTNDLQGILEDTLSVSLSQTIINRAWMELTKLNRFYNFRFSNKSRQKSKSSQKPQTKQNQSLPKKSLAIQIKTEKKVEIKKNEAKKDETNNVIIRDESDNVIIKDESDNVIIKDEIKRDETKKDEIIIDEIKKDSLEEFNLNAQQPREKESKKMEVQVPKKATLVWRVENFDACFSELAKTKQKQIQNKSQNQAIYIRVERGAPKYLQCHYLMQLQAITHIVSFMVCTFRQKETSQNSDLQLGSQQYIFSICKKVNIASTVFRKFWRLLRTFISKYPPKVNNKQITIHYLEQVLTFLQKLVIWHQIFSKINPAPDQISPGNIYNRFWVFKYKYEFQVHIPLAQGTYSKRVKEQQLKLTTFDQRIMFQLLCEGVKSLGCFQNQAYCFEYYDQIFKPGRLNLGIEYRCPSAVSKHIKTGTRGLIINSTPNDEDLHIYSDKPSWSLQQTDIQDKKFDRQNYSQIIRAYGVLIYDLCQIIPDGVVAYFPTREILRECRAQWQSKENIYERIYMKKRVFQEEQQYAKNAQNLKLFKKLCDCGRGAVFLVSAQSEFSKSQTFFGHYSKAVVFMGVPYNPISIEVQNKMRQLKLKESFKFDTGMRIIARCLSNCVNNPAELKIVLFADASFGIFDIRKKWFPFIDEGNLNTSDVVQKVKRINSKTYQLLLQRQMEQDMPLRKQPSFSSFKE